jgi:hypothetical protein
MNNLEKLVFDALKFQMKKYGFLMEEIETYSIQLVNKESKISISYRNGDFGFEIVDVRTGDRNDIMDLILLKYPTYLNKDSNIVIYNLTQESFKKEDEYIKYLVAKSFEFVELNYENLII